MIIVKYPKQEIWSNIAEHPHFDLTKLNKNVSEILADIKTNGDAAIKRYEEKFDHVTLNNLAISNTEIEDALGNISTELKSSISLAHRCISIFHESQKFNGEKIETIKGVTCWQKSIPIEKVGLYIPGGTAPLFSTVLMLATPAKIAGCKEIILCTPPNHEGKVNPAILAAAHIAGVSKIFKVGGVQAIGAMAFGTETVPKVHKIFGPGNQFVMAAKQQVSLYDVAIDMPAGPSEVCIIADDSSNPAYVAADLLSQAEHGIDSQVMLITTSPNLLNKVQEEIYKQLQPLPRREIATQALENSKLVLVKDYDEAVALSNYYAPEHLILATQNYESLSDKIVNAGSVFLGQWACESAGDYASGTNHTLPTHQYALAYNGVNLDSYNRKVTFQHLNEDGIKSIGSSVICMAENEKLAAHANAMRLRMQSIHKS